jgi:hypothetical protein
MEVRSRVIDIAGEAADPNPPAVRPYPAAGSSGVSTDVVVKAFFSKPVKDLTPSTFSLTEASGAPVPGFVDQIGDGTWAFFPHRVFLAAGKTYTARLAGVCDLHENCTHREISWTFTTGQTAGEGAGDTNVLLGFAVAR